MDAISKKVVEDTLIDVKFSGLSWRGNEGFIILVTKTKRE
jgi:prolyl oligopeptidase